MLYLVCLLNALIARTVIDADHTNVTLYVYTNPVGPVH